MKSKIKQQTVKSKQIMLTQMQTNKVIIKGQEANI